MTKSSNLVVIIFGVIASSCFNPIFIHPALAETSDTAQTASPQFDITRYLVEGNTILPVSVMHQAVLPFTGKNKNFADVQRALEALQKAYQQRGYGSVEVVLPEQELRNGLVTLRVIEQKLHAVSVEGNKHHDDANILHSLPSLKIGEVTNTVDVARNLRVANENPSKQTVVQFKDSESAEGGLDAVVKVEDEKPSKIFITLDNSGNNSTGNERIGVGYQNYNVLNRDDRFSAQFVTAPEVQDKYLQFDKVQIFGLGYSIPLYARGDSIDLIAGYSDVNAGSILGGALNIASSGLVYGARYNFNLKKLGDYQQKLTLGFDYKDFRPNTTTVGGANQTPHATVTPISLTYQASWQKPDWQLSYNVGVSHNIQMTDHGGPDNLGQNLNYAFPWLSNTDFTKFVYGADYVKPVFKEWLLHLGFSGQWTEDHLHPGEQFGLGGIDSVRGWHERAFSGDKGYRTTIEFTSPDFGDVLNRYTSKQVNLRTVFFIDEGFVNSNANILDAAPGKGLTIASAGAGLRFGLGKSFVGRFDYAYIVNGDITNETVNYAQSRNDGDFYGHLSLAWLF